MKKFIISEEEKRRILNLHEGFKKELLKEQVSGDTSGTTIGAPVSGWTPNNDIKPRPKGEREPISQKALEWGRDYIKGVATSKQYPVNIMNLQQSPGEEPVTFNMYIILRKSSKTDGSWLGYNMQIYDVKSKKMMDSLSIDCNTVGTALKNHGSEGSQKLDYENGEQLKWYYNKQFLIDLKQTLGCK
jgi:hypothetical protein